MYDENPYRTILQMIQLNLYKGIKVIKTLRDLKEQFLKADFQNEVGLQRIQNLIDYLEKTFEEEELQLNAEEMQTGFFAACEMQSLLLNIKS